MKRYLLLVLLAIGSVCHAQGVCSRTAVVNATAAGITQVLAPPGDLTGAYHICGFKVQITQAATAANYNLQTCTAVACTGNVFQLSPIMQGHAAATDNYNMEGSGLIQVNMQRGHGVYLNLSGVPAGATVQLFYAFF